MSSQDDDFNTRNKILTAKRLKQGYRYHKLCMTFSKFYWRHFDLVSKCNVELKTLLLHVVFRNLNFMATWCIGSQNKWLK